MKPKLIVTCNSGRENKAKLEVGDVLFYYDEEVFVKESKKHRGVLAVYTKINPYNAYRILVVNTLAYPQRIVPVVSLEDLSIIAKELEINAVGVRCEARGMYHACRELSEKALEKLGIKAGKGEYTLHIESIENYTGYSILPAKCDSYNKVLYDNQLLKKCIKFSSMCEWILKRVLSGGGAPW